MMVSERATAARLSMTCFCCGKLGHRAAECSKWGPKASLGPTSMKRGSTRKSTRATLEKSRGARQMIQSTLGEEISAPMDSTDTSGSEGEADPMLCMPIKPFVVQVVMEVC